MGKRVELTVQLPAGACIEDQLAALLSVLVCPECGNSLGGLGFVTFGGNCPPHLGWECQGCGWGLYVEWGKGRRPPLPGDV